jgi:hypothetical protein
MRVDELQCQFFGNEICMPYADLKVAAIRGGEISIDVIDKVLTLTDAAWLCGPRLYA